MKKVSLIATAIAILASSPIYAALDATVPIVTESNQKVSLKKKVAIARFSNETRTANAFLLNENDDRIGKQASDILSARLAATGKFLMFERTDKHFVDSEASLKGLQESGISADYLIVGSVSEFGRSTESDTGMFQRAKTQRAYAKVNVRLVDATTGRIVSSVEGAGEATSSTKKTLGSGTDAGFDQSLTDKALSAAISQMITNISDEMTNTPWKSFILSEQDGSYIIAGGDAQGLYPGLKLAVIKRGNMVKNPQTGAMVELPGKKVATLNIDMTYGEDEFNQMSFASLVEGAITGDTSKFYISSI
ncbi:CsgG/HfaB family protein [Enterovibrio paralichthyis]|uniref:CsgG/HfaB family protein n=1 Tax=Enterovibrio paralichthyis TaxID=2853805 RepID=UPI001C48D30C|nr:CsgG/HfaB family protein [Enterovibrio paralichthyis]MBV7299685.1 CsgG/HfaB family protein [Enterovibrio paralichthyis]